MFTGCRREYHPEAQTSQKVTNKFAECRQSQNRTTLSNQKRGWILRIQKFRERIDLWLLYANLLLNVLYHIVMEMKIRESCLQTGTFIYKPGISVTKQDFHLQSGSLALQRGFSAYYLPTLLIVYSFVIMLSIQCKTFGKKRALHYRCNALLNLIVITVIRQSEGKEVRIQGQRWSSI